MTAIVNAAAPEEQRVEDPVAAIPPPPPSLLPTVFQKLEVVYGITLLLDDRTQLDGNFGNGKL